MVDSKFAHSVSRITARSGTTGVASKELDRFFVGAEMEREYAGLAGRRIGAAERGAMLGEIRAIDRGNKRP